VAENSGWDVQSGATRCREVRLELADIRF